MGPLTASLKIAIRAFIERRPARVPLSKPKPALGWPESVLIFDTETTTDWTQRLLFGSYRWGHFDSTGGFVCQEEGLFHADELADADVATLQAYVASHAPVHPKRRQPELVLQSRRAFVNSVFWRAIHDGALIVGFNLPFDLTRLAIGVGAPRGNPMFRGGFSVPLFEMVVPGIRPREHQFRPRALLKAIDSKRSLMGVTLWKDAPKVGGKLDIQKLGRFLDLRALVFALTGASHSLNSAAKAFGLRLQKLPVLEHGVITADYVTYCRHDVELTARLLEVVRAEWDRYELPLTPDKVFSAAGLAKGALRAMGLRPPMEKFDTVPAAFHGQALSAYYGGRTEVRVRRTPVPVVYVDFTSMYPSTNVHLGLWDILTADRLDVVDVTSEMRRLGEELSPDWAFDPVNWRRLRCFARVRPSGDILPLRAHYAGGDAPPSIGVNPLHGDGEELWYAGPDLVASWVLTGQWPDIVEAIALVPQGEQAGLTPITLRGEVEIDPRVDDFFKRVIEARKAAAKNPRLVPEEQERLGRFLKILANAGSYGVLAEFNTKDPDQPQGDPVTVWGHGTAFEGTSQAPEEAGEYCFPPLAALITAGARLMLALLEREVAHQGGTIAFGDTDSAAIVATRAGGLIPCEGGAELLEDGGSAIRALSWEGVQSIVDRFEALNPYDPDLIPGSVLKIEAVNLDEEGQQREIWAFAISAKRYALYARGPGDTITILDAKAHGLGHLRNPNDPDSASTEWIDDTWRALIREAHGHPLDLPSWADRPAVSRITISSQELLQLFDGMNAGQPYADQVKPFNFGLSVMVAPLGHPVGVSPARFHLVGPLESDPSKWLGMPWIDRYSGQQYGIGVGWDTPTDRARVKTYRDVIEEYRTHPEPKSLGVDALPCAQQTVGLLGRRPVAIGAIYYVGKETNKIEDVIAGMIHDPNEVRQAFQPPGQGPWDRIVRPLLRHIPIADIAGMAGVSARAAKYYRAGRKKPEPERWTKLGAGLARKARHFIARASATQGAKAAAGAYLEWWVSGTPGQLG